MDVDVCVTVRATVCMLMGIMSGCMFIYVRNHICIVIHPLIVCVYHCVYQCECDFKPLTDSVTFYLRGHVLGWL